ncbi:hypothetical protein [Brevundimonas diminuta]|uniref:hypothetical protein n=1 Tax=Brevundimonas diminuta TaxID=293 RepID=UPI0005904AD4|nr:hypothetical protein [Brevundimonas diminuta]OWR20273.1 hypothetical protein CD944_07595 [Brevundimonas diminuta]WQE43927.1 hypothetical protein U0020_09975 [Brevundimonas diminuta]SUW16418.1 Uncharacterised protein [Brevundimonas diminuta]
MASEFKSTAVALRAAAAYARRNPAHLYEVDAVFDNQRVPLAFTVRVKNLDGFGVGWLDETGSLKP